jgi:hypothetical protein
VGLGVDGSLFHWGSVLTSVTGRRRIQEHERYGDSVYAEIGADYRLRLPYGANGARLYVLVPDKPGLSAKLQKATLLQTGGIPQYEVINRGFDALDVVDYEDNVVAALSPGDWGTFALQSNGSEAGGWLGTVRGSAANTAITMGRQIVNLAYGNEGRTNIDLLHDAQEAGYDISLPSLVTVFVVDECVVGSADTSIAALSSNIWPAGSALRLYVGAGARIVGKGGEGGRGGDATPGLLAQNGEDGGDALRLAVDTVLLNYGKIQGGGGGGGGGIRSAPPSAYPGGGGGGGAGHQASRGGPSGTHVNGQPWAGGEGVQGSIDAPGAGGGTPAQDGGAGGAAGQSGTQPSGGGLGGGGGNAISKASGITLTKLRVGTIDGAEVVE